MWATNLYLTDNLCFTTCFFHTFIGNSIYNSTIDISICKQPHGWDAQMHSLSANFCLRPRGKNAATERLSVDFRAATYYFCKHFVLSVIWIPHPSSDELLMYNYIPTICRNQSTHGNHTSHFLITLGLGSRNCAEFSILVRVPMPQKTNV